MPNDITRLLYNLVRQGAVTPGSGLCAQALAAAHAEPVERERKIQASLRGALMLHPLTPLADAASLAQWPEEDTVLTAAYLQRPEHTLETLAAAFGALTDETLVRFAYSSRNAEALELVAGFGGVEVAVAVAGAVHASPAAQLAGVHRMIGAGLDPRTNVQKLDLAGAEQVAPLLTHVMPLATLVSKYDLGPAVHQHLAGVVLSTVTAPGWPARGAEDDVLRSLRALQDHATLPLRTALAADLAAAGVHTVNGVDVAEALANREVLPARGSIEDLLQQPWPKTCTTAAVNESAAATLAQLLEDSLGASASRWADFDRLQADWDGATSELLTAAAK